MSFATAQAEYDSATPEDYRETWPTDENCVCTSDEVNDECKVHNEPPCDRCGWSGACPDCDPRMPWEY